MAKDDDAEDVAIPVAKNDDAEDVAIPVAKIDDAEDDALPVAKDDYAEDIANKSQGSQGKCSNSRHPESVRLQQPVSVRLFDLFKYIT